MFWDLVLYRKWFVTKVFNNVRLSPNNYNWKFQLRRHNLPLYFVQDILFGLTKALFLQTSEDDQKSTLTKRNNPLKVIIMSATLNHQQFSEFFNNCPVYQIPGQIHPVEEIYCNYITIKNIENPSYISKVFITT